MGDVENAMLVLLWLMVAFVVCVLLQAVARVAVKVVEKLRRGFWRNK